MASKGEQKPPSEKSADKPADKPGRTGATGRFAYDGLERVLHEKARLSILSSLAAHADGLIFNDLKAMCSLTDGNLSRQLQVLQEAALIDILKGFKNNRPQTQVRLTPDGRERFLEYIAVLESVVADAMTATGKAPRRARPFDGLAPA